MRELTKSAFSFSWAMSLFSAQQLAGLFDPTKTTSAFHVVTGAACEEFDAPLRTLFGAGDKLQSQLVDIALGPFDPGPTSSGPRDAAQKAGSNSSSGIAPVQAQTSAGWGAMPLEGNVFPDTLCQPERISSNYTFTPHYVEVFGSRMHYVDEGKGDPILLVHGNATWSYIWRNVIPHLAPHARCVAPDLIGFGLSDKPDIEYQWSDQADYLEEFIQQLRLKNITLVLGDFGISLGMRYAMCHEHNVKRMAFFEGVFKTFASLEEAYTADFRPLFKKFRAGDEGGEGYQLLVDQNVFVEQLLARAAGRELTEEEFRRYREPLKEVRSRIPIWRLARSVPIGGEPEDVWNTMTEAVQWFKRTDIPKLLFYATPGGLVTPELVEWCRRNLKNLQVVHVGPGVHYLQETSPHVIGRELVKWLGKSAAVDRGHGRNELDEQSV